MRIIDTTILAVLTVAAGALNYQASSTRIAIPLPISVFHPLPFAQADAEVQRVTVPELSGISELISQIGTMGILAWFCWYVTSKAGPRLANNFKEALGAEREAHAKELIALTDGWIERQRIANASLDSQVKQQHDDIVRMATSVEQMIRHCAEVSSLRIARLQDPKPEATP